MGGVGTLCAIAHCWAALSHLEMKQLVKTQLKCSVLKKDLTAENETCKPFSNTAALYLKQEMLHFIIETNI